MRPLVVEHNVFKMLKDDSPNTGTSTLEGRIPRGLDIAHLEPFETPCQIQAIP